jgi:hypothetical protein
MTASAACFLDQGCAGERPEYAEDETGYCDRCDEGIAMWMTVAKTLDGTHCPSPDILPKNLRGRPQTSESQAKRDMIENTVII